MIYYKHKTTGDVYAYEEEQKSKDFVKMTQKEVDSHLSKYVVNSRKIEILEALSGMDFKSIRALRSGDTERLQTLENEAEVLREELKGK